MKFTALTVLACATTTIAASICTTTNGSPLLDDCAAAYNALPEPRPPGSVVACPAIYAPIWKLAEAGSCRIEAYSSTGSAACTDRQQVLDAAGELLKKCVAGKNVEGVAELKSVPVGGGVFEGIRIVRVQ